MKKGIALVLVSVLLIMCKTKEVIPEGQLINFVLTLEKEASPKEIKGDISFEMEKFQQVNENLNQWSVHYKAHLNKENKLKSELLNHPKVLGVLTLDQFNKMNSKKNHSRSGSMGKKRATKQ